jgi:hypothetical protein
LLVQLRPAMTLAADFFFCYDGKRFCHVSSVQGGRTADGFGQAMLCALPSLG